MQKWKINIIKNTLKDSEDKNVNDINTFLKKKKTKGKKKAQQRYQDFTEEKNEERCNKNITEEQK